MTRESALETFAEVAYEKLKEDFYKIDKLELAEAKARMALEDANQRIEQLEEVLNAIHECASNLADYNYSMKKIKEMAQEGLE